MTRERALELVTKELSEWGIPPGKWSLSSTLRSLDLDSLDLVTLVLNLEEFAGKDIPDSKIKDLKTVEDVVQMLVEL